MIEPNKKRRPRDDVANPKPPKIHKKIPIQCIGENGGVVIAFLLVRWTHTHTHENNTRTSDASRRKSYNASDAEEEEEEEEEGPEEAPWQDAVVESAAEGMPHAGTATGETAEARKARARISVPMTLTFAEHKTRVTPILYKPRASLSFAPRLLNTRRGAATKWPAICGSKQGTQQYRPREKRCE